MSQIRLIFISLTLLTLLLLCGQCYSHEGHQVVDGEIDDVNNLGSVNFSTSCNNKSQHAMNTGLALLHHMMYAQAEKHYTESINRDPQCAILYWGYSMTLFHPLWPDSISEEALVRGEAAITKGKAIESSQREKDYLETALSYYENWQQQSKTQRIRSWSKAHKKLYEQYNEDIDAASFYALSQLTTAPKDDTTYQQQKTAGELLGKIFNLNPTHPGAIHYSIHAYDNPVLAKYATTVADAYSQIAPDVPHALHMPSHIFVRLGHWDKVASWNIRSANAALKSPVGKFTSLHYVHAADYLIYSYMQTDNHKEALAFIKQMNQQHPIQATFPAAYALTTIPARIALEGKDWKKASLLKLRNPEYINWNKFPQVEAITYFSRGLGAARSSQLESAKENLVALQSLYKKTLMASPNYWAVLVKSQMLVVEAWITYAQGNSQLAIRLSQEAAQLEDSMEKNPVTPGAVLPARELLADMLMLNGDFAEALIAYQTSLNLSPNRRNSLEGLQAATAELNRAQFRLSE